MYIEMTFSIFFRCISEKPGTATEPASKPAHEDGNASTYTYIDYIMSMIFFRNKYSQMPVKGHLKARKLGQQLPRLLEIERS